MYPVHWDTAIIIKVANEVRTDDTIHRNLNVDTPAIKVDPDLQELRLSQVQQAQTADRFVDISIGESDSSDEPSDDDASRRLSMSDHHPLEEECEEEECEEEEEYEEEEEEDDDEEEEEEDEVYFLPPNFWLSCFYRPIFIRYVYIYMSFLYRSRMKMKTNYSSRQAFSSLRKQRLSRKEHPFATLMDEATGLNLFAIRILLFC